MLPGRPHTIRGLGRRSLRQCRCPFRRAPRLCSRPMPIPIFYISDLSDSLSSNVRLFADDTIVYLTIHSDADSQVLQKDLDKLANWENALEDEVPPR